MSDVYDHNQPAANDANAVLNPIAEDGTENASADESKEDASTDPKPSSPVSEQPRTCFVSVRILSISKIDMTANTFRIEMIVFLLWKDPALEMGQDVDWESAWSPNVTMANCKEVRPPQPK